MLCSGAPGGWGARSLLLPLCIGNSVFFWWFALALLEDDFRLEAVHVGVLIAVLALGFARVGARIIEHDALGQALAVAHNLIIWPSTLTYCCWLGAVMTMTSWKPQAVQAAVPGWRKSDGGRDCGRRITFAGRPSSAWMHALQSLLVSILAAWAAAWLLNASAARLAFQNIMRAQRAEPVPVPARQRIVDQPLSAALEHAVR